MYFPLPASIRTTSDASGHAEPRPRLVQPLHVLLALQRALGQEVRELGRVLLQQPLPLRLDDARALLLLRSQPALVFKVRLALQEGIGKKGLQEGLKRSRLFTPEIDRWNFEFRIHDALFVLDGLADIRKVEPRAAG